MFLAFDHHKRTSYVVIRDNTGQVIHQRNYEKVGARLDEILSLAGSGPHQATLEAGLGHEILVDALLERGVTVKLAHPQRVKAIAHAKLKNDKVDALVLSHLLYADLIPEAHITSKKVLPIRRVLRQRKHFTEASTKTKNRILNIMSRYPAYDEQVNGPSKLWSKAGRSWLETCAIKDEDRFLLNNELSHLKAVEREIATTKGLVADLGSMVPEVVLIKTVPGIADYLAAVIHCEIDGIERFKTAEKLVSYAGLDPTEHSSGSRVKHGPTGQSGNKTLQWALYMAVPGAIKQDRELRDRHQRIKGRRGGMIASSAIARTLLVRIHRVLSTGQPYFMATTANS